MAAGGSKAVGSVMVEKEPAEVLDGALVAAQGAFGAGADAAMNATLEGLPDVSTLVVDLSRVSSIDGRGIASLLAMAHRLGEEGRTLVVRGAAPALERRLRAVGLHRWAALS